MADEEASPDEGFEYDENDQDGSSGSGKKKIILIAAAVLLLLGGGGAGVYFSGILDEPKTEAEADAPPPPVNMVFYPLPEILTNLNGNGKKAVVLKARVILELVDGTDISRIDQLQPRIIDILNVYLRELRIDDLRGPQGLEILRQLLLERINVALEPVEVSNVLFHDILIQ